MQLVQRADSHGVASVDERVMPASGDAVCMHAYAVPSQTVTGPAVH